MTLAAMEVGLSYAGAGAVLAWATLPVFARLVALRFVHEPSSSHRALAWGLLLSAAMFVIPWLRPLVPHPSIEWLQPVPVTLSLPQLSQPLPTVAPGPSEPAWVAFYLLCAAGGAWFLAVASSAVAKLVSWLQLRALLRRAQPASQGLQDVLRRCSERLRVQPPPLLTSAEASVPFAAIPWSPVIVLPVRFADTFESEALELTLEHELFHIRRRDLASTLVLGVVATLFAAHPTARQLLSGLAFAREASVDAVVSKRAPLAYANLLVDVAAIARFDQLPRPVSLDDTALKRRIAMLTDPTTKQPRSVAPLIATAGTLSLATLLAPTVLASPLENLPILQPVDPPADGSADDVWRQHQTEVRACFEPARAQQPDLTVHTMCTLEIDGKSGKVRSARAPIPASPPLEACIEEAALSWVFPVLRPLPGAQPLPPLPLRFPLDLP